MIINGLIKWGLKLCDLSKQGFFSISEKLFGGKHINEPNVNIQWICLNLSTAYFIKSSTVAAKILTSMATFRQKK